MLENYPLNARLENKELSLGLILNFAAPQLVELASIMGFDFVMIDGEHGPVDPAQAEHMIRVAELARVAPLVRVPAHDAHLALRYLDLGAVGIIFPHIETAQQARDAVDAVYFPPKGRRGVAPSTSAAGYGARKKVTDYLRDANRQLLAMMIIETPGGVEAIDEIIAVEGVSGVLIGAMDLSAAMGFPGNPATPEVRDAIDHVMQCCKAAEMPLVMPAGTLDQGGQSLESGASMLFVPIGSWLAGYGRQYTDAIRNSG